MIKFNHKSTIRGGQDGAIYFHGLTNDRLVELLCS